LTWQLPHLLRRSHFAAEATFSSVFSEQDVTSRQAAILLTVMQQPEISQAKLGEATGLDENTLSDIVSRMARKKFISRARLKEDKRTNGLTITPTGKKLLDEIGPTLAGYGRVVASGLTPAEHDELVFLLRRLLNMENQP
jgi:DNA-binding MarR family transcriptional regulator